MLTPYPPPSLLLLTSTTGRLMIASWATRRLVAEEEDPSAQTVVVAATTVVAGQWRQTGWGGNNDVENARQSVICVKKRGGDAGREVAIQQTAGAREMVAQ